MKKTNVLLATAMVVSAFAAVPAFAEKGAAVEPTIANEAMWDAAPAPANFDARLRLTNEIAPINADSLGLDAGPIIVLDPGHGGSDPGAVANGIRESDMTLDIANRTKSWLATNFPSTVYQTRTSDVFVDLSVRTSFANSRAANFFVSMHINSYSATTANGIETYSYYGSVNGKRLATKLYDQLKLSYASTGHRGVKEAGFYVLANTNMPASLGETGFISNYTDATNLKSTTFRQNLASQYGRGMYNYYYGL